MTLINSNYSGLTPECYNPSESRFCFLVATARRRRRRRRGISPSGFFLAPSALRSGSGSESMEEGLRLWSLCTGARSRRLVVSVERGRRSFAAGMKVI